MSKAPFIDDNDDSNNSSSDCHDSVDGNSTQAHEDTCSNYNEDICSIADTNDSPIAPAFSDIVSD